MKKKKRKIKKAPFIILVLLIALIFTNCSGNTDTRKYKRKCANLERQLEDAQSQIAILEDQIQTNTVTETPNTTTNSNEIETIDNQSVISSQSTDTNIIISATSLPIPQISAEDENISVGLINCGNTGKCNTVTEEELNSISTVQLAYYGQEIDEISLIISGVTVNSIYKVKDKTFEMQDNVSYVDNTYITNVSITGNDANLFMIQTVNGNHYYVSVRR